MDGEGYPDTEFRNLSSKYWVLCSVFPSYGAQGLLQHREGSGSMHSQMLQWNDAGWSERRVGWVHVIYVLTSKTSV